MQFLKFENMILLLQIINNFFEFNVTKDRNIIDFIATKKALESNQRFPSMTSFQLTPINKIAQTSIEEQVDLIMGRLPIFCPEASQIN